MRDLKPNKYKFWLTQKKMVELFSGNVRTVSEHVQNIFKSLELTMYSTIRKFRITIPNFIMTKTKVAIGLSGGVDSAVAAQLLVDQGYDVTGVFMRNWEDGTKECTAMQDAIDAEKVAKHIGIPFVPVNFSKEYWDHVFEYFLAENKAGRTPNPDILCNKFIKFDAFLNKCLELGMEKIATGHYAKIRSIGSNPTEYQLCIPKDTNKDQTYFLHQLNQFQLSKTIFPLADLTKPELREMAQKMDLPNADRKDSTGICFIGERNYFEFLQKYIKKSPGDMIEKDSGKKVGTHSGLSFYTIGQRKNLHIGGVQGFEEAPWFVVEKDFERNVIVVSQDEKYLLATELMTNDFHWIAGNASEEEFECLGKVRYRDPGTPCVVKLKNEGAVQVVFKSLVRGIAPGQSVVLYEGEVCLGGGEIS
jgi:tRNA-specific 2-thiouridylase